MKKFFRTAIDSIDHFMALRESSYHFTDDERDDYPIGISGEDLWTYGPELHRFTDYIPNIIPVCISGPSGVGKTTLLNMVQTKYPQLGLSISCTTRGIRFGETDSVDYYFMSHSEFRQLVAAGGFLEWKPGIGGFLYGTPEFEIRRLAAQGHRVIMINCDPNGLDMIRRTSTDVRSIFILPPDMNQLEAQLRSRNTEDEAMIEVRLKDARRQIRRAGSYDYVLTNNDLEKTADDLCCIMRSILLEVQKEAQVNIARSLLKSDRR